MAAYLLAAHASGRDAAASGQVPTAAS
jgi:hypothetical protein